MQNSKLTPGNLVILIAGGVIFLASFLTFYKYGGGGATAAELKALRDLGVAVPHFSSSASAWDTGLFAIATLAAFLGLVMAIHVAVTAFASVKLPSRVGGLTWNQIHLALGFQAVVLMLAFLIKDKGGASFGIGYFLMLVASIALLVGAVMRSREPAASL